MSVQLRFGVVVLSFLLVFGIAQHRSFAQQPFQFPPGQGPQIPQQPPPPAIRAEDILRLIPQFFPQGQPESARRPTSRVRPQAVPQQQMEKITPDHWHVMSVNEQGEVIGEAVKRLDKDLGATRTGEGWKKYLQVALLQQLFASAPSDWPDAELRKQLAKLADTFDQVNVNPKYQSIVQPWGFQTLHVGLREYSREPLDRSQRQLAASQSALAASLDRLPNGDGWKDYLQLSELARLAGGNVEIDPQPEDPGQPNPMDVFSHEDIDGLKKIESRFQDIQGDSQYAMVTQTYGFLPTLERLGVLLVVVQGSAERPHALSVDGRPTTDPSRNVATLLTPDAYFSGDWTSNLGKVRFRQTGDQVSGTLTFSNGVVATITGTVQGSTLTFAWQIPDTPVKGKGKLVASSNGNELTGTYQDVSQGTDGPFNLTRSDAPPLPAPPPIPNQAPDNPAAPSITPTALVPAAEQDAHFDGYPFAKAKARSQGQPVPHTKITYHLFEQAPDVP